MYLSIHITISIWYIVCIYIYIQIWYIIYTVKVRLPRLLAHGHLRHPFIGVSTRGRHVETGHQLVALVPRARSVSESECVSSLVSSIKTVIAIIYG